MNDTIFKANNTSGFSQKLNKSVCVCVGGGYSAKLASGIILYIH